MRYSMNKFSISCLLRKLIAFAICCNPQAYYSCSPPPTRSRPLLVRAVLQWAASTAVPPATPSQLLFPLQNCEKCNDNRRHQSSRVQLSSTCNPTNCSTSPHPRSSRPLSVVRSLLSTSAPLTAPLLWPHPLSNDLHLGDHALASIFLRPSIPSIHSSLLKTIPIL